MQRANAGRRLHARMAGSADDARGREGAGWRRCGRGWGCKPRRRGLNQELQKPSTSTSACFRIARSVPSGMCRDDSVWSCICSVTWLKITHDSQRRGVELQKRTSEAFARFPCSEIRQGVPNQFTRPDDGVIRPTEHAGNERTALTLPPGFNQLLATSRAISSVSAKQFCPARPGQAGRRTWPDKLPRVACST